MTNQQIIDELKAIAARMETIESECKLIKGYAVGAAELALTAIHHTIDLVSCFDEKSR